MEEQKKPENAAEAAESESGAVGQPAAGKGADLRGAAEVISAGTAAEKEAQVQAEPAPNAAGAQEGAPQYTEAELKKRKRNNTISFLISLVIIGGGL